MAPERIEELRARRAVLVAELDALQASPKVQRYASGASANPGHPTSWRQAVESTKRLIAQIDKVLAPLEPSPRKQRKGRAAAAEPPAAGVFEVLASVPNTPRSETRVAIRAGGGRTSIDVRVWRFVEGGPAVPTLKGVTVAPQDLPALIAALQTAAQQLVPAPGQS